MIIEITGLPGNGKTLYALHYVKQWAEKENRPVFYSGIADLRLPWTEIEPDKWMECPANSIIVIDECQRVFRPRSTGKEVPPHVAELETHRHKGVDIVLITQHPLLTDTAVRRLVGKHMHVVRKWGTQSATIHEWPAIRENCDKPAGRKDSIKKAWAYDKSVFQYYKSAEVHTMKREIPLRVFGVALVPVIVLAAIWYMYGYVFKGKHSETSPAKSSPGTVQSVPMVANAPPGQARPLDPIADARQFAFEQTPRVKGLPHTAPRYDGVTKAVTAPVPVACVSNAKRCSCYSQQGTVMGVEEDVCRAIVDRGFFVDFEDNVARSRKADSPQFASLAERADAVPVVVASNDVGHIAGGRPRRLGQTALPHLGDVSGDGK